ncbi:2-isopropylmalate synthase [Methanococcoides alaskense]|uniref:(R)-citramalate synthase n=1 Tax=Methanococcoides alaskense TaxID=325778 RepID=UPI0022DD009A|nr:(R)-citramalate synthase [Methanococcoides alaskense]MDA0524391.1 2-isopropylmalate synthase [Methanococcoides alaskense]
MALFENIRFLDTTLRDGEQTPGVALKTEEKVWIARKLDELGVDIIEAGSAITSEGEREAIRAVSAEGLDAEICSYCRIMQQDVDFALECDVDSIHLVAPVSDLHISVKLKKDRAALKEMALSAVEYAKDHGLIVELSGEDASRADLDFLKDLYKSGVEVGADRVCFCDTVGLLVPERTTEIFKELSSSIDVPVAVHCHNDFGLAVSNTVAALNAGAREAHMTVNGIGERAGNAALEEVVMVLEWLYKRDTGIQTNELYKVSRLVSRLTGLAVAPNKSLVGGNAFTHEAGIHVHGLLADTSTYEPISPESIGRERQIVLGKHAGKSSVTLALKEQGLDVNKSQLNEIVSRVKELGDHGKRVTDADLQTIAETVLDIYQESKVKLEDFTVVSGNRVTPTASVRLTVDGKEVVEAAIGDGPVDAAFEGIRKAVSGVADIRLEEYHVDSITGGTDALVEVLVKLSKDGKMVTSRGARTDIIMASVEAVINGINQLIQD